MKQFRHSIICFVLALTLLAASANSAQAEVPPKGKAFLIVCAYGTVGGALLGFASLAFGTDPRSIAQGASLGLYAGILFGTYVIVSHEQAKKGPVEQYNPGYPPPQGDPYAPATEEDGYGAPPASEESNRPRGLFDFRWQESQQDLAVYNGQAYKQEPPVYINLISTTF